MINSNTIISNTRSTAAFQFQPNHSNNFITNETDNDDNCCDKVPQLSKRHKFQQTVRNSVETVEQRLRREWAILSNRKGLQK